jgi:hypothetical protein
LGKTLFGANFEGLQEGIKPVLDKVFPMSEARQAHLFMESN